MYVLRQCPSRGVHRSMRNSTGRGAGDLFEPTLPYPTSSSFPFHVFESRPVMLVIPRVCSLPVPTLVSWDKRCWAHQMSRHFLPVLLPAMNLLFPLVWNILLGRFGAVYPRVVLWQSVSCSYMLNIFQMRGRVFKRDARVKHLWSLGGIEALSAPNLRLAVSCYNTSRFLNIAVANCFLDFQKIFNIGKFSHIALQLCPAGSTFTWTTTTAGNCNRTVPVKTKIYCATG